MAFGKSHGGLFRAEYNDAVTLNLYAEPDGFGHAFRSSLLRTESRTAE
jgi:hypothetical protein